MESDNMALLMYISAICDAGKELKSAKSTSFSRDRRHHIHSIPLHKHFVHFILFLPYTYFSLRTKKNPYNPHLLDINAAKAFFSEKFIKDYEIWKGEEISFIFSKEIIESICRNFKNLEIRLISYFHLNFIVRLRALYDSNSSCSAYFLPSFHLLSCKVVGWFKWSQCSRKMNLWYEFD